MIVYDPLEAANIFLETQILSFAIVSGTISEKTSHTPKDHTYAIRVLDNQRGLLVVYHGKHWSLVSLKDTIQWRKSDLLNSQPRE